MKVHSPEKFFSEASLRVSARIETDSSVIDIPKYLWYELPEESNAEISSSSDAFLRVVIILAMYLKEDIEIKGNLSKRLFNNLESFQDHFASVFKDKLSKVDIRSDNLIDAGCENILSCRGLAFGGGIDSMYTLFSCLKEHKDTFFKKALFINGSKGSTLDRPEHNKELDNRFRTLLSKYGIELFTIKTNAMDFTNKTSRIAHKRFRFGNVGPIVISSALMLQDNFSELYISSSGGYAHYPDELAYCTNPETDKLFSTENMEIIHYGAELTRLEKTVFLSDIKDTYDNLLVCYHKQQGMTNCCKCSKCIRTMLVLFLEGKLKNYSTFPLDLDFNLIKRGRILSKYEHHYFKEIIEHAESKGNSGIIELLKESLNTIPEHVARDILDMFKNQ